MADFGKTLLGGVKGAAGGGVTGASLGPYGAAGGAALGGVMGVIGSLEEQREEEKRRKKAMAALEQRQALENDVYSFNERNKVGNDFANVFQSRVNWGEPLVNQRKVRELRGRGQQIERDQLAAGMESQGPSAGDWIGALLAAGGAVGMASKSDPYASRRKALNNWSDEADFINSRDLPNRAVALEELDDRTRSTLFGPRRRMNPYEF